MKFLLSTVVVLAIGTGGFFLWRNWQGQKPADSPGQRPTTAEVVYTNINFAVYAAGDIGPADQISVRPEVNGRIELLPVDIGDNVKKGELLCKMDDSDLQIERSQRLKEIEAAQLLAQLLVAISPVENAPVITVSAMLVAFVFSALVGGVAGLFPAVKAAKLDPIQALRYE